MKCEYIETLCRNISYYTKDKILYDNVEYKTIQIPFSDRWMVSSQNYFRFFGILAAQDLTTGLDSLRDRYPTVDLYYFIEPFISRSDGEATFRFLLNNYFNINERLNMFSVEELNEFIDKSSKLNGNDKKNAFIRFVNGKETIDNIVKSYEKEELPNSVLDQFNGQIIDMKTVNWGIGQIMKLYPKKYNPTQIKEALIKHFNIGE